MSSRKVHKEGKHYDLVIDIGTGHTAQGLGKPCFQLYNKHTDMVEAEGFSELSAIFFWYQSEEVYEDYTVAGLDTFIATMNLPGVSPGPLGPVFGDDDDKVH